MQDPLDTNTNEKTNKKTSTVSQEEGIVGDINDVINNTLPERSKEEKPEKDEIIGDISQIIQSPKQNISEEKEFVIENLADILEYIVKNEYDLFTLEPKEEKIKIIFRKNKVEKGVFYIGYPVYNRILLRAKAITGLKMDETQVEQEGKGSTPIGEKAYSVVSKTVPSTFGEKILIKIAENKKLTQLQNKTGMGSIIGFLGVIVVILLIIGGSFLTFIVMNANTVEDVKFFSSMRISLNEINDFIESAVNVIFSSGLFIQTIILAIFLFKFFLTKKIYKKRKIVYGMIAVLLLMSSFGTGTGWMYISKKIAELPNWQELSYGSVQIYDTDKLSNNKFEKKDALIRDTSNLIAPINLKYDLGVWVQKEERKGFKVKKIIWNIGGVIQETVKPISYHELKNKGNHKVVITVIGIDKKGRKETKELSNIKSINIANVVKITEKTLRGGGKTVEFDASDFKGLGKIKWYTITEQMEAGKSPDYTGYIFRVGDVLYDETIFGMSIQDTNKEKNVFDRVFVIGEKESSSIQGKIKATQDPSQDLRYTFQIQNAKTESGNGFIKSFTWDIEGQTVVKKANIQDLENSSKMSFRFDSYGKKKVSVSILDGAGTRKVLKLDLNIPKKTILKTSMKFFNENKRLYRNKLRYEKSNNKYFINQILAPTKMVFDATGVRSYNNLYDLKSVSWDINGDGSVFKTGKKIDYELMREGNYTILVTYTFQNNRVKDDSATITETIYIEVQKKEAILNLKIEPKSRYAPTSVRFDASESQVSGKNIEKFIFNYGDGIIEEGDGINPAHNYKTHGNYEIIMTTITTDGTRHSITKSLILKPQPQKVKAKTSMSRAPIDQGIDFSSEDTQGQVNTYFWDFGDGEVSTKANPSHSYQVPGVYNISLKINFSNNNTLTDEIKVTIFE